MRITGIIGLCLIGLSIFAIDCSSDISVLKLNLTEAQTNESKIDAFQCIILHYMRHNKDSSIIYGDEFLKSQPADTEGLSKAYKMLSLVHFNIGDFQTSHSYCDSIKIILEGDSLDPLMLQYYFQKSNLCLREGRIDEGHRYISDCKRFSELHSDTFYILKSLNHLGYVATVLNNLEEVIKYNQEIYEIARSQNNSQQIGRSLYNMGTAYTKLGDFEAAEKAMLESLRYKSSASDYLITFSGLGKNFLNSKNFEKAIHYYEKGLHCSDTAKMMHTNKRNVFKCYTGLAKCYNELREYSKGLEYSLMAKELVDEGMSLRDKIAVYESLSNSWRLNNNYEKAWHAQKIQQTLKDSLWNKEKTDEVLQLEQLYESKEQELEIEKLSSENLHKENELQRSKTRNILWVSSAIILLLGALLLFGMFKQKQKANEILEEKNEIISTQKESAELRALLSQMNPHFISNFLNTLHHSISKGEIKDEKVLSAYISKFGRLSRMILEHSNNLEITIQEELDALKLYLDLEQLRTNNKFQYQLHIDPLIDVYNSTIPPMLFQPFAENAIWHGLMPKGDTGLLSIDINLNGEAIKCSIKDNGVGVDLNNQKEGHNSHATRITKERIELTWKKYEGNGRFQINSGNEGTEVLFELPLMF
ncbi:MAG: histidine kinase [Flavobacteriales bacterium]|nr:histidine kinase [Flavobacteriales bacterium]